MKTRRIGKTSLQVTEYSFGGASLGNLFAEVSKANADATLEAAWSAGMRYFDTAPHYGFGLSERRFGDFLRDKQRDSFVLSTKVGRLLKPAPRDQVPGLGFVNPFDFREIYDYSYDGVMRSIEDSYQRLGLNQIDILYVHDIGVYTHGVELTKEHLHQLFEGGGIRALEALKSSGVIGAYGLGVNEVEICLEVIRRAPLDVILLAGRYSLLDRSATAELIPACRKAGISLVIGGVFNSGILATGAKPGSNFDYGPAPKDILDKVSAMEAVASKAGYPLAQAALQFPLSEPCVSSILVGTAKPSSLVRNMELLAPQLAASEYAKFDGLTTVQAKLTGAVRE